MPVIFITDFLIFLLLFGSIAFFLYARKQEHLTAPWREIKKQPLAMSSAVILSFFIIFGLLDSAHFHPRIETDEKSENVYSNEILSVLDLLLKDLRLKTEKTYSAPLASYSFSKELIELEDGKKIRDYPRLLYGGANLDNPKTDSTSDIIKRISLGFLYGLLFSLVIILLIIFSLSKVRNEKFIITLKKCLSKNLETNWMSIFITMSILFIVIAVIYHLSQNYHVFGTDKVGQDVLYQALKSIRTGLVIGTLTTLVMLPFAIAMGLMAGYFRGWVDDVIQYLYTTLNSIPGVLLIAASILLLQVYISNHANDFNSIEQRADLRLLFLCIILGITSWTGLCRLLRAETLKLREIDYVQAAKAFGVSNYKVMLQHLLPNVMHIVMISIVLDFSGLVLAEAVLSYINIGVDPSMYSWGNMINSARLEMAREPIVWWSLTAAFIFMFILVLAANLFSDAVRDAFDPRLREF